MLRQLVGWVAAISGMGLWLSAKYLGIGPMVGMNSTTEFVLIVVLFVSFGVSLGIDQRDEEQRKIANARVRISKKSRWSSAMSVEVKMVDLLPTPPRIKQQQRSHSAAPSYHGTTLELSP